MYIHWVASARLNRLQEREFEPSRQARVLFLLDASSFAIAKAVKLFEKSIEVLASLAIQCDRQGFGLGLATDGRVTGNRSPIVPVGRSGRQTTLILETLAAVSLVNPTSEYCLTDTLKRIEGIDSGLSCVLFTLSRSVAAMGAASMLRQKNLALTTVYCLEENTVAHEGNYPKTLPLADLLPQEATKA